MSCHGLEDTKHDTIYFSCYLLKDGRKIRRLLICNHSDKKFYTGNKKRKDFYCIQFYEYKLSDFRDGGGRQESILKSV